MNVENTFDSVLGTQKEKWKGLKTVGEMVAVDDIRCQKVSQSFQGKAVTRESCIQLHFVSFMRVTDSHVCQGSKLCQQFM